MLKKSIALCLLSSSLLAGYSFSQEFTLVASIPNQFELQDKIPEIMQEAPAPAPAPEPAVPVQLDRSGIDRASVHLQILQQTNLRFIDSGQPAAPAVATTPSVKKTAADEKKPQAKSTSNS